MQSIAIQFIVVHCIVGQLIAVKLIAVHQIIILYLILLGVFPYQFPVITPAYRVMLLADVSQQICNGCASEKIAWTT